MGLSIRGQITVIEVKSGHADFSTDKKWREYLTGCDRLYFCVGFDHWKSHGFEIKAAIQGTPAGVLVLGEDGHCYVAVPAKTNPLDDKSRLAILSRVAWRNSDRNAAKNRRTRRILAPVAEDTLAQL